MLYVTQAPGGTVIDVRLGTCNGDQAVRESITNAVFRASPLPPPPDARAFERRLEINFEPRE
jgi:colicin import membrane protein